MLTKKAQYAFRALTVLAKRQAQEEDATLWTSARDIVDASPMSLKFLEQILVDLKAGGIIKSRRGPAGGHALSGPAEDILLAKVIRLMDGPIAPLS
ncbi:MAG: RrF2 family transcriptional regulator [Flavobacteriales bacterium]